MPPICVMTFMFKPWWTSGRMSMQSMLEGFASMGIEGVEPFHRDFVEAPDLVKPYCRVLDETGLKVPAVDVIANLVYADDQQKQESRDELRRGLDICKDLGADIAHVAGHKLPEGVSPEDGRKMIAEGLADSADLAESYGLTLAIEDYNPSPTLVCSAADCLEIMRLSGGRVKFVFDTGNFAAVNERADEVFASLREHIVHVHIKDGAPDAARAGGLAPRDIGKGEIPNANVAQLLNGQNYHRWIAIETHGREEMDPLSAIEMELPVVQNWFGL